MLTRLSALSRLVVTSFLSLFFVGALYLVACFVAIEAGEASSCLTDLSRGWTPECKTSYHPSRVAMLCSGDLSMHSSAQ